MRTIKNCSSFDDSTGTVRQSTFNDWWMWGCKGLALCRDLEQLEGPFQLQRSPWNWSMPLLKLQHSTDFHFAQSYFLHRNRGCSESTSQAPINVCTQVFILERIPSGTWPNLGTLYCLNHTWIPLLSVLFINSMHFRISETYFFLIFKMEIVM